MTTDPSRTPTSINNVDNVRGSLYDDETGPSTGHRARAPSAASSSGAGGAGPSRRRAASPHRFTVSPLVPPSQRDSFAELLSKRQPPSCDACRTRKLKCSGRPGVIELGPRGVATRPCSNCKEWSLDCSYQYQRKRRGRKNRVVERLAQEQQANRQDSELAQSSGEDDDNEDHNALDILALGAGLGTSQARRSRSPNPRPVTSYDPMPTWTSPSQPGSVDRSIVNGISPTTFAPSFQPNVQDPFAPYPQSQAGSSVPGHSFKGQPGPTSGVAPPNPNLNQDNGPSMALAEPMPPPFSIESILPRELALSVIERFFEHVYSIIPVFHRPTFNADIAMREEERRPILLALIFATISLTLLHIPRTFFTSLRGDGVQKLSLSCLRAAYSIVRREENILSVELVCIKYFYFVIHNINRAKGLEASALGEAAALAIAMGLHREDSYHGINPIEAERRRRVWFLIFNADKFEAVFTGKPVLLRPDEFVGPESTELPAELEDRAITANGYLQSSKATPLIVGFNIFTRLVTIIGDLLIRGRDVRRHPPRDSEGVLSALKEVRKLQARVKAIADGLPMPFKLDGFSGLVDLPAPGWEDIMRDQLDLFYQDPMASETAKDGYLVMRANIHVSLAMTRLRIILHRDDLLNLAGPVGTPSRNAAELVAADLGESADWRLGVYQDLFNAVHGIPIQALAANGPSLVHKIRVVAVTLIDALPAQDYGNAHVQGIAAYLLDFLNIMTSIESQFND